MSIPYERRGDLRPNSVTKPFAWQARLISANVKWTGQPLVSRLHGAEMVLFAPIIKIRRDKLSGWQPPEDKMCVDFDHEWNSSQKWLFLLLIRAKYVERVYQHTEREFKEIEGHQSYQELHQLMAQQTTVDFHYLMIERVKRKKMYRRIGYLSFRSWRDLVERSTCELLQLV
jgi:hypothetical protein